MSDLFSAIKSRDASKLSGLLGGGEDVNSRSLAGEVPLVAAVRAGNIEVVRMILGKGANVNLPEEDEIRCSALMAAAAQGWADVVRVLIESGAQVDYQDATGSTALCEAAGGASAGHEEVIGLLIAAGAKVDLGSRLTPLMIASESAGPGSVRLLLKGGASANESRVTGTPLIRAIRSKRADNVSVLLEGGADPHARALEDCTVEDAGGLTPIEFARKKRINHIVSILGDVDKGGALVEDIGGSWRRIENQLRRSRPAVLKSLGKGATQREIRDLEGQVRVTLPLEFKESLAIHNGQSMGVSLIPDPEVDGFGFRLMTTEEIVSEWNRWKELSDMGEFDENISLGADEIRGELWWQEGWIPFAENGSGDSYCIDMNPSQGGKRGQVIVMNHESPRRELLSASFGGWLHMLANILDGKV